MTSLGVMQTGPWKLGKHKYGNGAIYKLACMCGSPKCDAVIMFDLEDGIFRMHMYKNLSWDAYWKYDHWYQRVWARVKASAKILFTGWIELEDDITVDPVFIPDIIKMYQEAQANLEEYELNWERDHQNVTDSKTNNSKPAGQ